MGVDEHPVRTSILGASHHATFCPHLLNGSCAVSRTGELRKEKNKRDKCLSFVLSFLPHSFNKYMLHAGHCAKTRGSMGVLHASCSLGLFWGCLCSHSSPVAYAELPDPLPWTSVGRGCRPHCRRNLPLALLGLLDIVFESFGNSFMLIPPGHMTLSLLSSFYDHTGYV